MNNEITYIVPTLLQNLELLDKCLHSITSIKEVNKIIVVVPEKTTNKQTYRVSFCDERILIVREKDSKGLAAAINLGITYVETNYWNWLGDDDQIIGECILELLKTAPKEFDGVFLYGDCRYSDQKEKYLGLNKVGKIAMSIIGFGPNLIPQPSCIFPRTIEGERIFLDTQYSFAFDQELIQRILKLGSGNYKPGVNSIYRWDSKTLTMRNRKDSLRESLMIRLRYAGTFSRKILVVFLYPLTVLLVKSADARMRFKSQN